MGVCKMEGPPPEKSAAAEAVEMVALSRDAILGARDAALVAVPVPEWGGTVYVRAVSGTERDAFEAGQMDAKGKARLANFRARFAVLVACDQTGAPLFGVGDVEALGAKAAAPLDRILEAGMRLNGLRQKDVDELSGE